MITDRGISKQARKVNQHYLLKWDYQDLLCTSQIFEGIQKSWLKRLESWQFDTHQMLHIPKSILIRKIRSFFRSGSGGPHPVFVSGSFFRSESVLNLDWGVQRLLLIYLPDPYSDLFLLCRRYVESSITELSWVRYFLRHLQRIVNSCFGYCR